MILLCEGSMRSHPGLVWFVGLLAVGVVGSPAAHATLATTAQVLLTYEDSSTHPTFDETDGGPGSTDAWRRTSKHSCASGSAWRSIVGSRSSS